MLNRLFCWLLRRPPLAPQRNVADEKALPAAFEMLNQQAPLRQEASATQTPAVNPEHAHNLKHAHNIGAAIICREAVLNRQQKIAGYQFMLQNAAHAHIRPQSRRILHLYTEVLVQNIAQANIGQLLGHRIAFIETPDSFLGHPVLKLLPAANTCFIIKPIEGSDAPPATELVKNIRTLRAMGYRIGIPDPVEIPEYFHLIGEIDVVCLQGPHVDIEHGMKLVRHILKIAPQAALLARDLPAMEDFDFCFKIGTTLFQGPFITSRESWTKQNLGPNYSHLAMLLNKLRQDADTPEIVALLKQDGAITLRLLRYINSAATGLREHVASIERALILLGREPLRRWLALMLCASNRNQPRAGAVLEAALVRARTMELIATQRPPLEREAMFLTGLLSLIDVILQQPLDHALESLNIDTAIRDAILDSTGPYASTLALAKACEHMDVSSIVSIAAACGVDPEQASIWYMDALAWTLTLQQEEDSD
ncbi:MAG: HDOD domain-containing protein [Azoarcus sp.]|jgi:EAL and modified HD-GYP domain-containing signal transduction protein|nr:HDOD domain-containing protein [Azoarcus sp.]